MQLDPRLNPARSSFGRSGESYSYPFGSWSAVMQHHDTVYGEKPWMIHIDEHGNRFGWSYAVFIDVARRLATLLQRKGIERGSRVAIAGHNHPDTILSYFACWMLGACAVPLNMTEDDGRLTYILDNSGAAIVLCRTEYMKRIEDLPQTAARRPVLVDVDTDATDPVFYETLRTLAPAPWQPAGEDMRFDECLIVYTSGTTGNPKGVVLMQQNLFADGYDIAAWHGVDEDTRMMCVLPVHHVNGTIVTHVAPFLAGASIVLNRKFSATRFFDVIRRENVRIVSVVPTLLAFLLEADADASGVIGNGFRHIICGAGPLTCELANAFESRYGIPIVHGYGLSETTCYNCFLPADLSETEHRHWMQDYGFPSIGIPLPCNEMAIHDDHGNAVGEGERGEIVARGPNTMKEYYANEKANAEAFAYGWFRSGDEGFYVNDAQERPYFFITGRLKELIIRGGINLAPLEIDEVLARAPGVKAGICVGFVNDMYGEEVGALVVPDDASSKAEDILAFCREHLPFSKAPKVVLFTDTLPVTSTGKYQRNKVKHLFADYQGVQFRQ